MTRTSAPSRRTPSARLVGVCWPAGLALLACTACAKSTPEPPAAEPVATAAASTRPDLFGGSPHAGGDPHAGRPLGAVPAQPAAGSTLRWTDPKGWTREGASAMRLATLRVPHAPGDSDDAELAVFHFGPGGAGGVDANIQRWVGQFQDREPKDGRRSKRTLAGLEVDQVEIDSGTFASGMPGAAATPKTGYALIGAIVAAKAGAYFFKLTGPKATVKAARADFDALLASIKE